MIKHTIAALALTLSLASSAVQAQETNCDGWMSSDTEIVKQFWEVATSETVADCLNSGSSVNTRDEGGHTPLFLAALYNENPEVLTVLLEAGADVNVRAESGSTPLHGTAYGDNPEVLTVLLNSGADVNARNAHGRTPLFNVFVINSVANFLAIGDAKRFVKTEVLTMFLEAGAELEEIDVKGMSMLHFSVTETENPEALIALIGAGANVNVVDIFGQTPLHQAAERNENPEFISVLLAAGADGAITDRWGRTPFDIAKENEALVGTDVYWALNDARFE